MKATKYIAIAFGIVAALLVAGWFLRNTIIERLSKPVLGQFGLTVTDVSLDALATRDASIGYLELEHTNGTTIAIDELTLPIRTAPTGVKTVTAAKVSVDLPAGGDDAPLDLAGILTQLLALPLSLPPTVIDVAEVSVSGYPVIRGLRWQLTADSQEMAATVESVLLTATVDRVSDTTHSVTVSVPDSLDTTTGRSVSLDIQQTDAGISFDGTSTVDLSVWTPVSALLDFKEINVASGAADLRIEGTISNDPDQAAFLYAELTPTTPVQLTYSRAPDAIISIAVQSASTIEITATFPEVRWSLRQAQASLLVSDGDLTDIPVSLINLSCQSGTTCSLDVDIEMEEAALPFAKVGQFEFAASQDVTIGEDGLQLLVRPNATLYMSGISGPDLELAGLVARLSSAAELDMGDTGWQFSAQSADLDIEDYAVSGDIGFSAEVFLDDIAFSTGNRQPSVKIGAYASSSRAKLGNHLIRLPGFKGNIARQGGEITVDLATDGLFAEAGIEARHNLDDENGQLSFTNASLSFASQDLASRIAPRPKDWNISAGTLAIDLRADWQRQDTDWQITAETSVHLTDLSGAWNDTAFADLSTRLDATFDTATGFAVRPATVEIALIDMGLPVENITADYTLHPDEPSVEVGNLRMTAFGGVITADPFSFSTANERNTLLLRAHAIDLAEIVSTTEFQSVEITGRIGAELPMTIEGQTVRIDGGTLTGEAPGGVIRYLPGIAHDQADTSSIGIATRALSNFEYETLTSEVDYTTDGNLSLQMRLRGRNPDLEGNRPVILNFGLEDNVPQMLRSLRAARAVEEILERRLAQ